MGEVHLSFSLLDRPAAGGWDIPLWDGGDPVEERIEFDPARRAICLSWQVRGVDVRWPELRSLESHLARLAAAGLRDEQRRHFHESMKREVLEGGETVFDEITSIDIPIQFPGPVGSIIGQGANIEVSGSESISFGGESSYLVEDRDYGFGQRSRFPQLDMRQHLTVKLNGTIGEKIQVMVDHDSETQTPLENRIRLRYSGHEDEVIQSIEMGNTNLNLRGAQFVGYSGRAQGLFGAKLVGRLGAFDFTTIASKQEGRTSRETFVGRARADSVGLKDLDFEKRRYLSFWPRTSDLFLGGRVENVTVYVDDHFRDFEEDNAAQPGYAYRDWNAGPADPIKYLGNWQRLDELADFEINPTLGSVYMPGMLVLNRPVERGHSLAVAFTSPEAGQVGDVSGDTLELQMIHPGERIDTYATDWESWYLASGRELKNIYYLGAQNISLSDYQIVIRRSSSQGVLQEDNQDGTPFIELMGLDQETYTGSVRDTTKTDGIVDAYWIDPDRGLLVFPNPRPFNPDPGESRFFRYVLTEKANIYDQTEEDLNRYPDSSRYAIAASYRTPQTTFSLNRFGIIRDSEIVTLNGERLTRGVHYQIDYDLGQITFITEEAKEPDAEIGVDFEYAPLLAQAQKTLLGMSGVYQFSQENRLGVTWLYESTTTPELRPRLGQEPTRTLVGDIDFQWASHSERVSHWVNSLPLVRAQAPSELRLAGEVATSFPNPNVKDEVYLDDMDGSKEVRTLGVGWRQWVPASAPLDTIGLIEQPMAPGFRPNWYSPRDVVRERDIFLGLTGNEGDAFRTVLELRPHPWETERSDTLETWVGIMRLLSSDGANLSEQKFLEIWVDTDLSEGDSTYMYIDLGDISEDFYPIETGGDSLLQDEYTVEGATIDDVLDEKEDVGLDGQPDEREPEGAWDDNYHYDFDHDRRDYLHINGPERNHFRDTEDLNLDGTLRQHNAFFRARVDLANEELEPNGYLAIDNATLTDGASTWRLYRIPFDRFETRGGSVGWDRIRYVRLWFEGLQPDTLQTSNWVRIGSMEIIGNAWLEDGIRDLEDAAEVPSEFLGAGEEVSVQVRNNKEHSEYSPPFEVEEIQTPQGRFPRREQSLALVYQGLGEGHMGLAHKTIIQTTEAKLNDYSEYRSLSFFIRSRTDDADGEPPTFFVRVGGDAANFYEYRVLLEESEGWRSVDVSLDDLPRLKLDDRDTVITYYGAENTEVRDARWGVDPSPAPPLEGLAVYGNPSLTRVLYLAVGVRNDWEGSDGIAGELWIDELRLRRVRREPGLAARVSASMRLSDLVDVSVNYTRRDGEFRNLGGNRTGHDDRSLSASGRLSLHKLFENLGFNVPISARYSRSRRFPRLLPGSDIVLDDALQYRERSVSRDYSLSTSLSHATTSSSPWGRLFLDGFQTSGSLSRRRSTTPEAQGFSRDVRGAVQYQLTPPFEPSLSLWRSFRMGYLPQDVMLRADGSRITERVYDMEPGRVRGATKVNRATRTVEGALSVRYTPLTAGNMSSEYSFEMYRDLDEQKGVPLARSLGWGFETRRRQSVGWRFQPGLFGLVTPLITYQGSYNENRGPQVRRAGDPEDLRRVSNSGDFRVSASVSPKSFLRRVAAWWDGRQQEERRERESEAAGEDSSESDSTSAEGEPPAPPESTGPGVLERMARGAGKIQDISLNFSHGRRSDYPRTLVRPSLSYQLGIGLDAQESEDATSSRSRSRSFSVKSGGRPLQNLSIDLSYAGTNNVQESSSSISERQTLTWPDVSLSLSSLEKWGPWRRFLQRASLNSGLRRRVDESSHGGSLDERKVELAFSPLFQLSSTWRSGLQLTLTGNHSRSELDNRRGLGLLQRSVSSSLALGARYALRVPRDETGTEGSRWRSSASEIKFSADLRLSSARGERLRPGGDWELTNRTSSISLEPQASYTFSRNITGSAEAHFVQNRDHKKGETRRRIGIYVSMNIRF